MVYNVHTLIHLTANAEEYGGLDACSAFMFENYLQQLKKMVCSPKNPVVQIIKRLQETDADRVTASKESKISAKQPNNVYMLTDSTYCEIVSISNENDEDGNKLLLCRVYTRTQSLFDHPCDSHMIGISTAKIRNTHMTLLPRSRLFKRAMRIEQNQGKCLFMAILHDF